MKKIDNHDKKVAPLNLWDQRNEPGCNCGIKSVCPLEGNCTAGDRVDLDWSCWKGNCNHRLSFKHSKCESLVMEN